MHVDPERYSVLVQLDDAVQTSSEPVIPLEVALEAHAHTASLDGVAGVFAYSLPVGQTVTANAHSVTTEVSGEVEVDW